MIFTEFYGKFFCATVRQLTVFAVSDPIGHPSIGHPGSGPIGVPCSISHFWTEKVIKQWFFTPFTKTATRQYSKGKSAISAKTAKLVVF